MSWQGEIGQVDAVGGVEHDVLGLQVAATPCSCAAWRPSQIWRKSKRTLRKDIFFSFESDQVLAFDELHREVLDAVGLARS